MGSLHWLHLLHFATWKFEHFTAQYGISIEAKNLHCIVIFSDISEVDLLSSLKIILPFRKCWFISTCFVRNMWNCEILHMWFLLPSLPFSEASIGILPWSSRSKIMCLALENKQKKASVTELFYIYIKHRGPKIFPEVFTHVCNF